MPEFRAYDLIVSETQFKFVHRYRDAMPPEPMTLFLVARCLAGEIDGCPFLLGLRDTSYGVDVRYNSWINPLLERDLQHINLVDVSEIDPAGRRDYQVPLLHSFD